MNYYKNLLNTGTNYTWKQIIFNAVILTQIISEQRNNIIT